MEANGWRYQARWFGLYIKEAVLGTDRRQCLDHSMFWWYGSFAQVETKQAVLGTDKLQCLEHVFWWYESLAQVDIKQAVLGTDKRQCLEQMFWWYESLAQVDIKQAVLGTNKRAVPRSHFFYVTQVEIIEGSLEVKLPTIWTDEKQSRAEAERRERSEERIEEKE